MEVAAEADAMVTVFGILNLTEDSFFDESRRLDPAGAVTAAIEMLRVGSDVVDVGLKRPGFSSASFTALC